MLVTRSPRLNVGWVGGMTLALGRTQMFQPTFPEWVLSFLIHLQYHVHRENATTIVTDNPINYGGRRQQLTNKASVAFLGVWWKANKRAINLPRGQQFLIALAVLFRWIRVAVTS